jgi:hypothetical protein
MLPMSSQTTDTELNRTVRIYECSVCISLYIKGARLPRPDLTESATSMERSVSYKYFHNFIT